MIKKLLSLAACAALFIGTTNAQQISNAGFETWSTTGSSAGKATGWAGYGDIGLVLGAPTYSMISTYSKETTIKNSGTASIKIETKDLTSVVGQSLTGFVQYGTPVGTSSSNFDILKVPYSHKPTTMSGYLQYNPTTDATLGIDSALVLAVFSKWNSGTNQSDVIGYTQEYYYAATSGMVAFNQPIMWGDFNDPDSMYVVMISSAGDSASIASHVGSVLYVDDITFGDFATGKKETISAGIVTKIAPNPASNVLNLITSDKNIDGVVRFIDVTGKLVKEVTISTVMNNINIEEFNNGVYFYQVLDANNKVAATGKFSVIK